MAHGTVLLLGTVAVLLAAAAGVMYLIHSYRLKHKLPQLPGLRLPSLEWLQRFNTEALVISSFFVALGLISGIILNFVNQSNDERYIRWSDPVIISSAVLLAWLLAALLFEFFYRPAREGRKVAYLTIFSLVFLLMVLGFALLGEHAAGDVTWNAAPPAWRAGG